MPTTNGNWRIEGHPKGAVPIPGDCYLVNHSRKGIFKMSATSVSGEWLTGIIIEGTAEAMMEYNVKEKGDEVTIRDTQCWLTPLLPKTHTQKL